MEMKTIQKASAFLLIGLIRAFFTLIGAYDTVSAAEKEDAQGCGLL